MEDDDGFFSYAPKHKVLNIHPDETKSLTKMSSNKQGIIHIDDIQVAILTHEEETYHAGQNDYRPAFFISTSNSGKNDRDPAKDLRIPGKCQT